MGGRDIESGKRRLMCQLPSLSSRQRRHYTLLCGTVQYYADGFTTTVTTTTYCTTRIESRLHYVTKALDIMY